MLSIELVIWQDVVANTNAIKIMIDHHQQPDDYALTRILM